MNPLVVVHADLDAARETLEVRWGDGHESRYSLKQLRAECPCAVCRTAREEARTNPFRVFGPNERPPSAELAGVEPVGRYGLRFAWADGHDTGIYTFDYLRELCPCESCRPSRPDEPTPYVHGIYIPK